MSNDIKLLIQHFKGGHQMSVQTGIRLMSKILNKNNNKKNQNWKHSKKLLNPMNNQQKDR